MILTIAAIKQQLRLEEDDTNEDLLLEAIGMAAESRTATLLNRPIYASESERPDGDDVGMVATADLRLAMLMLVSHFYEHRSSVSDFEQTATPMAYEWIVRPYRFIPL